MATLQIELEDMAGASWWAGVLATLASQSGNAYLRFVGRVDGQRRYKGATFPAPRTLGPLPPQEAWAPGMTKSLQDLRREIENDGWVEQAGVPGPGRSGTNIPNRLPVRPASDRRVSVGVVREDHRRHRQGGFEPVLMRGAMVAAVCNVNDVLDGHVSLDLECLDRVYLNAYVPNLQVGGQVVVFLTQHLGNPIPSPAIFTKIGNAFRVAVARFAEEHQIPVVRFAKDARKQEVMRPYLEAATRPGVVAIGVAQEFQNVFCGWKRKTTMPGAVSFAFAKADRRVSVYYFYVLDRDFGPGFIKLCSYFPYPAKVWVNGHEWAKRQATSEGLAFTELANGFASCEDPAALQAICDRLGPADSSASSTAGWPASPPPSAWLSRPPATGGSCPCARSRSPAPWSWTPPAQARAFFEALVADNLDLGRPDEVKLIFGRRIRKDTPSGFATKVVTRGVEVAVNVFYRHSRIKQYLKEGRALRVETVVNSPTDLGCQRRLRNLGELQAKARAANRRLLTIQRVGQGCAIASQLFERVALPSVQEGQRTGALRFGDPRVMALAGALCILLNTVVGFTNRSLRAQVSGLLGGAYSSAQMTYDLRRLRLNGLIRRIERTNRYVLTPDGVRVAVFYTKLHHRLLGPLLAADRPPAPPELRQALRLIDHQVDHYVQHARLGIAA